jgi:hypothetical protein
MNMKHKLFFPLFALVICSFITEPFAYYFSTVDPESGKDGTKPEKTTAVYQKPKGKATTADYIITGTKSPVRLKIAQAVFNAYPDQSSVSLDPKLYIALFKLGSSKTNRILSMSNEGGGPLWIPIHIYRPDPYSIKVTPGIAMQPGEYALIDLSTKTSEGNVTVWTFGID